MTAASPWPTALAGTPAIAVIERAIERKRLSHSLLLQGDDPDTLTAIALAIADRLLSPPGAASKHHFPPDQHPDCFFLRPAGRARIISAEATRELIAKVQISPAVAMRKVAIICEADRMNAPAANIFLKTLEEPPANTMLLLVTTRPYALLPTIRSRVLHFRFPGLPAVTEAMAGAPSVVPQSGTMEGWLDDYRAWLGRLAAGVSDKKALAHHVFTIYGLVARFSAILEAATDVIWKQEKEKLPADIDDDEQVAIETGIANGIRTRLLVNIAQATRDHVLTPHTSHPIPHTDAFPKLVSAIERLEHNAGLLRLNLNESAALEDFLLSSLRLWTGR